MSDRETGAISFGTRIFDLLDRAATTSTYKYAVLLCLLDVVQSSIDDDGDPPQTVTTRQLAEAAVRLYWRQAKPYGAESAEVLRQNSGGQAKIVQLLREFQLEHYGATSEWTARRRHPDDFERLVRKVEWVLVKMPLPKLQRIGGQVDPFIYDFDWDDDIQKTASGFSAYQRGKPVEDGGFNNLLRLRPGVAESLLRLAPLLRPMIEREWARTVGAFNDLEIVELENFLFREERTNLGAVAGPLRRVQKGACFYCAGELRGAAEVDHFIPWSRSGNDGLANLVLAHRSCNNSKSNHIADVRHLERWLARVDPDAGAALLTDVSEEANWPALRERSLSVAHATYGTLPPDMPLWWSREEFRAPDVAAIGPALRRIQVLATRN